MKSVFELQLPLLHGIYLLVQKTPMSPSVHTGSEIMPCTCVAPFKAFYHFHSSFTPLQAQLVVAAIFCSQSCPKAYTMEPGWLVKSNKLGTLFIVVQYYILSVGEN